MSERRRPDPAEETDLAAKLAGWRAAFAARSAGPASKLDGDQVRRFLDRSLPPVEADALAERLLADPAASRRVTDALRRQRRDADPLRAPTGLARSRLAGWLRRQSDDQAGRGYWTRLIRDSIWLGNGTVRLPAQAVSFANELSGPFSCRLAIGSELTVDLVEQAGGLLAVHVRSDDHDLAGQRLTLALTPTGDGEPLEVGLDLADLGEVGVGGFAILGPLSDLITRLGDCPECAAVLHD